MKRLSKLSKKQMEWINLLISDEKLKLLVIKQIKEGKLTVWKAQTKKEMKECGVDFNYPYKFFKK